VKRIVSVSRRTDIPAFYGEWFVCRLRQGWAVNYNPYNHKASEVPLTPKSVAALVFWSKNFKPFLPYLDEIDALGYHSFFIDLIAQYTGLDGCLYRIKPTRKQCGCCESVDIGMYDTCPHACFYCYANNNYRVVQRNYRLHNPASPLLRADVKRAAGSGGKKHA